VDPLNPNNAVLLHEERQAAHEQGGRYAGTVRAGQWCSHGTRATVACTAQLWCPNGNIAWSIACSGLLTIACSGLLL